MAKKGRNKEKCKAYQAAGKREKNKQRKLMKHLHLIELKQEKRKQQIAAGKTQRWFKRNEPRRPIKDDVCAMRAAGLA